MNNYSWLEQKLHKFALSSQFMREVTFDFESNNIFSSTETGDHVFITGLARAGTTILLNALYKSNIFASSNKFPMLKNISGRSLSILSAILNTARASSFIPTDR